MTNLERLEQVVALISQHIAFYKNTSSRLVAARKLANEVMEVEKANENLLTNTAATLSIANGFLRDVMWLMDSVPNFSDGVRKSYDMTRDINAFLQEQKK